MPEQKRLIFAIIFSTIILFGWQFLYEAPRNAAYKQAELARQTELTKIKQEDPKKFLELTDPGAIERSLQKTREQVLSEDNRVKIFTNSLHGSIDLRGARIDDLTLAKYKESIDEDSKEVILLSPSNTPLVYFAEFGWIAEDKSVITPDINSIWKSDGNELKAGSYVTLSWVSPQNITFITKIGLDDNYMFSIKQSIENNSGKEVILFPYAVINRNWVPDHKLASILHEGALGVMNGRLEEVKYTDMKEDEKYRFDNVTGWFGVTDKYWLTSVMPDKSLVMNVNFKHTYLNNQDRYQVDYIGDKISVADGEIKELHHHFFAGAKQVSLLDKYAKELNIPLFDRAVDFGMLYFLTKPIFQALKFFYNLSGNFGVAILLLTVVVKILLFPLASKGYESISKMKALQPEMEKIKERYKEDRVGLQKAIMELYKTEKINPLSGCLPILIQLPVFFALYKVLFVTIEMRQAPFFGWIKDLSVMDPSNIFNLFGLIPINLPMMLHMGVWPLIMGLTMFWQQKMQPTPSDPIQAKVMKWLPVIFTVAFARFPAGLLIYWSWNNLLSILQQWIIAKKIEKRK